MSFLRHEAALQKLTTDLKAALKSYSLTPTEFYILIELYRENGQKASVLARNVNRPTTSFTPILDALVKKGWVSRHDHPTDRRALLVKLTQKATNARQELEVIANAYAE